MGLLCRLFGHRWRSAKVSAVLARRDCLSLEVLEAILNGPRRRCDRWRCGEWETTGPTEGLSVTNISLF